MIVRCAQSGDVDRMMEVIADGRSAIASLGIDQWQNGYPSREVVEADVARGEAYVVVDGETGRIVGSAMIGSNGDPGYDEMIEGAWLTPSTSADPDYIVMHRVATAAEATGRGVASTLVGEACKMALGQGKSSVRIDTHPGNEVMKSFLTKHGFAKCGSIRLSSPAEPTPQRFAYELILPKA